ncbi:MAG: HAMP domain-containing protein [Rhodospirillales bacterium]|nr:HAMP domain-containing protein [Rhodospirillales bacterium]
MLVGITLYVTNTQTTTFERARIIEELQTTQLRFEEKFRTERAHTLKLVRTITSDQKYRSFLQQVRDNFFSFAEEIAKDTDADIVTIFDEDLKLRGFGAAMPNSKISKQRNVWMKNATAVPYFSETIHSVLEDGKQRAMVMSLGSRLVDMVHVPLKEARDEDYAVAVVSVGHEINDKWVEGLAGGSKSIQVVFYKNKSPVASNLNITDRKKITSAAMAAPEGSGSFVLDGERFIVQQGSFKHSGDPSGYVFTASLDKAMAPFVALQWKIFYTAAAALGVGILVIFLITNKIVLPIRILVDGTRRVVAGDYDFKVEKHTKDEVGELSEAFGHMVDGLKEKELIRNLFGKYVHPSIVNDIIANPENLERGGTRKVQTLLFSDIAGFTTISEGMDAEELVSFLNEYMGAMAAEISSSDGILDKYLGDGIMAFWGPPFTKENHALCACRAALGMQKKLFKMREIWRAEGRPRIDMRIGLATGDVVVGDIGSEHSRDYTCIGDTVNLSSRLEGVNKVYGTGIIIDLETRDMAGDTLVTRELDTVQVKGRDGDTRIFELLGIGAGFDRDMADLIETYESGLSLYRQGEFEGALKQFDIAAQKGDTASTVMSRRCREYQENPPAEWTGIRAMDTK